MMFRLCIIDNETGVTFEWNGSHTVELRDAFGKVFDVFSFGDFGSNERPSFVEFAAAVENWLEE
jgi:hypothetical protein